MPTVKLSRKKERRFRSYLSYFASSFSTTEVINILVAWAVLSFAFSFVLDGGKLTRAFPLTFGASAIVLGCGFIMHELMHKFSAQKYGYPAEFRLWPMGIILALITSLFGFIFAAPGATYFEPDSREQFLDHRGFTTRYGIISLAGPKINLFFGFLFFFLFLGYSHFFPYNGSVFSAFVYLVTVLGTYINFYLCAFNMLPIGGGIMALDGLKVWRWNRAYWALFFLVSAAMSVISFLYVLPSIGF